MREHIAGREIVPSEKLRDATNSVKIGNSKNCEKEAQLKGGVQQSKRIANAIVSHAFYPSSMEENVTIRSKSVAWSLTFSIQPLDIESGGDHVLEVLSGMELETTAKDDMMACEDDLFDEELLDLDKPSHFTTLATTSKDKPTSKEAKQSSNGIDAQPRRQRQQKAVSP
ncbi:unnamed protein product [Eruca vesicaria subsp. sativa]|uniref:Uncharacterized protein n=1 Tax=Eruca vesicaria subsp. sativa TaxID=29727 RepID=A0ABC8IZQ7_ERUVS|nr:unnamed protein product [Eruca vesicaria subsp. sativa]